MTAKTLLRSKTCRTALVSLGLVLALSSCTASQLDRFLAEEPLHHDVLTDRQLLQLRLCESGDNYAAKSANRRYFGAYQFSRATWDDVAGRYYRWLAGIGPHKASVAEQDAMTRALWDERGAGPWPVCGQRIGPR